MNGLSNVVMPTSLDTINNEQSVGVAPAGWTFAIWGVIYSLLAVFAIYQCLPGSWVKSRSDDFIFNQIGWLWSINMILNAIWLPTFMSNSTVGFIFAQIIIIPMLATALIMGKRAVNNHLSVPEMIGFRLGVSIYSGWLSTATILGAAIMFKTWGWSSANGDDEVIPTVVMLWIAFVIYCVNTFLNRDPIFGGVYIWACFGIKSRQTDPTIESNLMIIIILMSVYVALISVWVIVV
jgi:translocator protein